MTKEPTDLWIWLGDNAYCCGSDDQYQTGVFDFYGTDLLNSIPIMPVPGNHEFYGSSTAQSDLFIPYFDIFNLPSKGQSGGVASGTEDYYSFDYGNVHFIALDSYGMIDGKRLSDPESGQFKWLESDLAANTSPWTVVFFHHPPYSVLGHVSDAEQELRDIRLNLIPLFDNYGVDLVLNGHSHSYERTKLIKNHRYGAETFREEFHLVQPGSGNYKNREKPYLKKNEGTVYAVVGSAGRLDWNGLNLQLPATYYQNKDIGGSLRIRVEENRLDGEWIAADNTIKDAFTFFKQVNRRSQILANWGENVRLEASWKGSYRWPDGSKERFVNLMAKSDTMVIVSDSLGYLHDTLEVSVSPRPEVKTVLSAVSACAGTTIEVNAELKFTSSTGNQFLLNVMEGDIKVDQIELSNLPDAYKIPKASSGKIQLSLEIKGKDFIYIPADLTVSEPAFVKIANAGEVYWQNQVEMELQVVSGDLPVQLEINDSLAFDLQSSITRINLNPEKDQVYQITHVGNICGEGEFDSASLHVLAPLSSGMIEELLVYPNPTNDGVSLILPQNLEIGEVVIFDSKGRSVVQRKKLDPGNKINLDSLPSGTYVLIIISASGGITTHKIVVK